MALPTFNAFSLQDDNYIVTDIEYRTWPAREIGMQKIARRPGMKFTSEEFASREISMRGFIKGSSTDDLQSKIDALNTQFQQPSKLLQIYSNRTYTATVASMSVGDPHYNTTIVPFEVSFVTADPFSYAPTVSAQMTVASGVVTQSFSVTISGSYFAEPTIVYTTPPNGTLNTTTSGMYILHQTTGEYITWSGTAGTAYIPYTNTFTADYQTYKLLFGTTQTNQAGVFTRWQPGVNAFSITFGGNTEGGTLTISYAPRYI